MTVRAKNSKVLWSVNFSNSSRFREVLDRNDMANLNVFTVAASLAYPLALLGGIRRHRCNRPSIGLTFRRSQSLRSDFLATFSAEFPLMATDIRPAPLAGNRIPYALWERVRVLCGTTMIAKVLFFCRRNLTLADKNDRAAMPTSLWIQHILLNCSSPCNDPSCFPASGWPGTFHDASPPFRKLVADRRFELRT